MTVVILKFASVRQRVDSPNRGGTPMVWDELDVIWKHSVGKVTQKWERLTDDDLTAINGKRDQLVGRIQERYEIAREAAEQQVSEFTRSFELARTAKVS